MDDIVLLVSSAKFGPVEEHVLRLAAALQKRGSKVQIWLHTDAILHPLEDKLVATDIKYLICRSLKDIWEEMRWERPALLHTHGHTAGLIGRLFATVLRLPVVSTYHEAEYDKKRHWLSNKLDQLTACFGTAIAVNRKIQKSILGRAKLVQHFVDLPPYAGKRPGKHIAFVGPISHEKGADLFCEIASNLPNIHKSVFGAGPMEDHLSNIYGEEIHFRGDVVDMAPHWNEIDLLCITSREEGLPLIALEAMSHGVPVAAFDVGGLADLIIHGESGCLVAAGDVDAFERVIKLLLNLPNAVRHQYSRAAYQTIQNGFSATVVLHAIEEAYAAAGFSAS